MFVIVPSAPFHRPYGKNQWFFFYTLNWLISFFSDKKANFLFSKPIRFNETWTVKDLRWKWAIAYDYVGIASNETEDSISIGYKIEIFQTLLSIANKNVQQGESVNLFLDWFISVDRNKNVPLCTYVVFFPPDILGWCQCFDSSVELPNG